jgi:hypothetical protein
MNGQILSILPELLDRTRTRCLVSSNSPHVDAANQILHHRGSR